MRKMNFTKRLNYGMTLHKLLLSLKSFSLAYPLSLQLNPHSQWRKKTSWQSEITTLAQFTLKSLHLNSFTTSEITIKFERGFVTFVRRRIFCLNFFQAIIYVTATKIAKSRINLKLDLWKSASNIRSFLNPASINLRVKLFVT